MDNPPIIAETITKGATERWIAAVDAAYEARKGWDDVVFLCREFYRGAIDFMWSERFQAKYFGGRMTPRFKVNLNKMFDMVALYGPSLVWDQVTRQNRVEKEFEYGAEVFGDPNLPLTQMLFEQDQQRRQQQAMVDHYQVQAFDSWLNYTPAEMPFGGMKLHSERCVVDGLISGRGVLRPSDYKMPGSGRKLTGCFWERSEDVLIDPDATSINNAKYIILRCVEPRWELEKRRGYNPGDLKKAAGTESLNSRIDARRELYTRRGDHQEGQTYDQIVYYKIWSKMGVGARLTGAGSTRFREGISDYLDKVVGDFAYLEVAEGIPHPLNANPAKIMHASDEEVARMFRWPIPFWIDNKWPLALLDFYHRDDMPYPIPPMSAALGPLIYMNIAMSNLANRVWSSSRDFIAIVESAWDTVSKYFKKGDDLALIKVPQIFAGDMEQIVKFLKQPPVSADQYQMLDRMSQEFITASGLSPVMYGTAGGAQTRSAKAEENREVAAGIRPQYMAKKVDDHQAEAAEMERQAAYFTLEAADVADRVPPHIWQRFVLDEGTPERIVRKMRCTVDATSGRRPNRSRDAENWKNLLPAVLPEVGKHADMTGDTGPVNRVFEMLGESIEQDMSGVKMGPRVPQPPPPEVAQQQQQMMEMDMAATQAKTQAELVKAQAAMAQASTDAQNNLLDAQLSREELQQRGVEAQLEANSKMTELLFGQEQNRLDLAVQAETGALKIAEAESLAATKIAAAEEMAAIAKQTAQAKAKQAAKPKPKAKAKA